MQQVMFVRRTIVFRYGNLARGNTHFRRTCFPRYSGLARGKHPHSAHLCLARSPHPRRPQGFGNLPISWPGFGKLPTRQSVSSLWSPGCLLLITQLGRVSPYCYGLLWGLAFTIQTLPKTVCGLPKQARKSLYLQLRSLALLSRAVDQSPPFRNNTIVTSDDQ